MNQRELEIREKWGPIKSQSDDSLKQIAKDLYNGLIYTDTANHMKYLNGSWS